MKIGKYISDLLFNHESVLLPGIGTFTKKYEPARFIPEQKIVKSPTQFVDFSPDPKTGETQLTAYITEQEGISAEEIKDYYDQLARETEHALEAGSRVELEYIGVFYKDTDGSLNFEPDRQVNYLVDNTGVAHVKTPSTVTTGDKETAIPADRTGTKEPGYQDITKNQEVMSEPAKKDEKKKTALSPALKWIAIILVPLLIILIILFLNYRFFFGENGFFRKAEPVILEEPAVVPTPDIIEEPVEDEPEEVIPIETEEVPAYDPYEEPPKPPLFRPVYIIVVGSFSDENNAQNLALQLRKDGNQLASVLDRTHSGFYRTYSGYYFNLDEAKAQKALLPDELKEVAWILHR